MDDEYKVLLEQTLSVIRPLDTSIVGNAFVVKKSIVEFIECIF